MSRARDLANFVSTADADLEIATSASDTGVDLLLDGNKSSNGGVGSIIFNNAGDSVGMIRSNRASANDAADMLFYTQATGGANSERMRILSGGGLTFNGDTAAANALDDYEEGTFTPVFGGTGATPSASYSAQTGVYTKVGRMVYASAMLSWSSKSGGSGQLVVAGLPFAGSSNIRGVASIAYNDGGITGSNGNILLHTNTASNYIYFMNPDSNFQSGTYMDTSYLEAAGHFQIAIVYST